MVRSERMRQGANDDGSEEVHRDLDGIAVVPCRDGDLFNRIRRLAMSHRMTAYTTEREETTAYFEAVVAHSILAEEA